ncbi:MAG: alpha/beta hydrolase [Burkholderiaceae bacterium]|jgi:pimeloyl-ACP methyl ester carboxylesterase|nr:alpha/beta hydrolase [Burkholderiaceae bacterium]
MTVLQDSTSEIRVDTSQGRLFVKRWHARAGNSGPAPAPMVLLHDSLGSVALWREFPQRLVEATGRDVLAYDRLGFGQSDPHPGRLESGFVAEEAESGFAALHQALGLDDFVALGHSVGGGMATMVAARYGTQCRALVTESAQAFVEDRTLQGIRAARDDFARPGQMDRLRKYHGDKAAWVLSAWVDTWLSRPFADYRLDEALERVRCPVLAIHGEQDEFGSLVHPERIRDRARGPVEVEIVAGGGHVPHREQPDRIAQRIARFLARV